MGRGNSRGGAEARGKKKKKLRASAAVREIWEEETRAEALRRGERKKKKKTQRPCGSARDMGRGNSRGGAEARGKRKKKLRAPAAVREIGEERIRAEKKAADILGNDTMTIVEVTI